MSSNVNLVTFEFLPALSKKAESCLDWIDIKLMAHVTKENPITSQGLKLVKNISGPEVRAIIHHLRVVKNRPIASCGKGYFTAHSPEELDDTIKHLDQRINSIDEVKNALVKMQRDMRKNDPQVGIPL